MIPCGVKSVNLAVEHVGEPGDRVPVCLVGAGEGSDETVFGKSRAHVRILGHISGIVEVCETKREDP